MARGTQAYFPLVQALRALAALSVAFDHTAHDALAGGAPAPGLRALLAWLPWNAGIDVFFVISGFVIATSTRDLYGTRSGPGRFLQRRLTRIVPLYWATTALFLAAAALLPHAINGTLGGPLYIIKSFAFLPAARPDGLIQPPLGLGWTLNYEMFFYVVFTPFVLLRRGAAVAGGCVVMALFVAAGQAGIVSGPMLTLWTDPIVLEFAAGLLLAQLPGRILLPGIVRAGLVIGAVVLLHFGPNAWPHVLIAGGPALAFMLAAILGPVREAPANRMERVLVHLGDASYALYLAHPFVMRAGQLLWAHMSEPGGPVAFLIGSLSVAQLLAVLVHRRFERPLVALLRQRISPRRPQDLKQLAQ
ncbi:MAG TPA: acyltransferase [Rhodopila sp.]|nr:acyltransferase [Rhodopila sp.]